MPQEPITPRQFAKRLRNEYEGYVVIGITGHRDLLDTDKERIEETVEKKLKELADGKPILLVSGLAMGADQWVAACAESSSVLCVPLTMTPYDYMESGFLKEEKTDEKTGETTKIYFEPEKGYYEDKCQSEETIQVKLYEDSLYNGRNRLTDRERDQQYEELGKFMTRFCDHLLALWDGVDGGGVGGTSDVVRMMVQGKSLLGGQIEQKKARQWLHQFVVPRHKNSFPIGRRFASTEVNRPPARPYTWVDSPIENRHTAGWQGFWKSLHQLPFWYRFIGSAAVSLAIIDIAKTWYIRSPVTSVTRENIWQDVETWSIIWFLYVLAGWAYIRFSRGRDILLQFIVPIVLAICVLVLGSYGFYEGCLGNRVDSFFGAANLITLNTSVFSALNSPEQDIIMNAWLKTARILGGFLAGYAFILAFVLATGRENVGRFMFRLHRFQRYPRKVRTALRLVFPAASSSQKPRKPYLAGTFNVVFGSGTMAVNVAIDLAQSGQQRVVLLTNQLDATLPDRLDEHRVWVFQGRLTSRTAVEKTFFWLANGVYVVDESDENNFRCAQELDDVYTLRHGPGWVRKWLLTDGMQWLFRRLPAAWQNYIRAGKKPNWYVHQQNGRQRELLQGITREYLRTFSISENTARRLLLRYPIDRFQGSQATIAEVAIVGFDQRGQDIALTCLRLGHYTNGKHLHLTIYYRSDEKDTIDTFRQENPELVKNNDTAGLFGPGTYEQAVQQYTFFTQEQLPATPAPVESTALPNQVWEHHRPVIEFRPLPAAENELTSPDFSLYQFIQPGRVVSVYVCQPTGLESAALLGSILPRIEWHKQGQPNGQKPVDVQVFCYYNFPDPNEEQYVEMKLNSIASYLPVVCFGNLIHECVAEAIRNESMNQIARQIALLYACLYFKDPVVQAIPRLKAMLEELDLDKDSVWKKKVVDVNPATPSIKNDINIAKAKALLPKWVEHKEQNPNEFANWLETCWQSLKEIDRESNAQAAAHAWVKLRLLDINWENPSVTTFLPDDQLELLSEVEHRRWNAEKLLAGWLPEPNEALWESHKSLLKEQKRHHFLMTFEQLPEKEQNKDYTQVLGLPFFFAGLSKPKNS